MTADQDAGPPGRSSGGKLAARLARHRAVGTALTALGDGELAAAVEAGTPLGAGIGGRTARLTVGGVPVFVKRIPLTDLERSGPTGSTANLFGLPPWYQYGVGSTGFGAWRELAAHVTTTGFVGSGAGPWFPMLHHWRVLPAEPHPLPDFGDWDGDPAVARRVDALGSATASVVLFLEHLPWTLDEWLTGRFAAGDGERAVAFADRELTRAVDLLRAYGIVHFDAHPRNVLTDGDHLYLADLGLALDRSFELAPAEVAFLGAHREWDRWDTRRYLVNWVCGRLAPGTGRTTLLRAGGPGLPGWARTLIARYAPTVLLLNDFYDRLVAGPKSTPYPGEELLRADRASRPGTGPRRR